MPKKQRKTPVILTLEQRAEVFELLDQQVRFASNLQELQLGQHVADSPKADRRKIQPFSISNHKNREKRTAVEAKLGQGTNPKRRRVRHSTKTKEVNEKVLELIDKLNFNHVPISGVNIREAAKEIAEGLHVENFQASSGWLSKVTDLNSLSFK